MKLTIDRERWLRGEGSTNSKLLRLSDGKMCCLGFYCIALGLSQEQIREVNSPIGVADKLPTKGIWMVAPASSGELSGGVSDVDIGAGNLIEINDSVREMPDKREKLIAEEFVKYGVDVEFVN